MHNLHIIRVRAENGEDAIQAALDSIADYGDDNNYRSACGAIAHDGSYTTNNKGRWDEMTADEILTMVNNNITINDEDRTIITTAAAYVANPNIGPPRDNLWAYRFKKAAENVYHAQNALDYGVPFDVWNHEYRSGHYDEFGITNHTLDEAPEGTQLFLVLIDMHN